MKYSWLDVDQTPGEVKGHSCPPRAQGKVRVRWWSVSAISALGRLSRRIPGNLGLVWISK